MAEDNEPNQDRWVDTREVMTLTGLGRSSITRLYQQGKMPEPFTIRGTKKLQWWESEILAWMREQDDRGGADATQEG